MDSLSELNLSQTSMRPRPYNRVYPLNLQEEEDGGQSENERMSAGTQTDSTNDHQDSVRRKFQKEMAITTTCAFIVVTMGILTKLCSSKNSEPAIAFAVSKTDGWQYCENPREKITFDKVRLNLGGGFIEGTNTFICPRKGLYQFCATLFSGQMRNNSTAMGQLIHDESIVASIYMKNFGTAFIEVSGTHCAPILANKGDRIWLRCGYHGLSKLYGYETQETTFTGILLNLME